MFGHQSPSLYPTLPAEHVRLSGFICCWSDGVELIARRHVVSDVLCRQLQTVIEDIFIVAVQECLVH